MKTVGSAWESSGGEEKLEHGGLNHWREGACWTVPLGKGVKFLREILPLKGGAEAGRVGCTLGRSYRILFGDFAPWGGGSHVDSPSGKGEMGPLKGEEGKGCTTGKRG